MAVLPALTGFAYDWVSSSWMVATLILKEVLILHLAKMVYEEKISLEYFEKLMIKFSRPVVIIIVALGLVLNIANISLEPPFKLLSQGAALFYFGFLFWRF